MAREEKEEKVLVWKDDTGTYKLGFSQYLQQKALTVNKLLLVSVIVLIALLLVAFWYANNLIARIDALDVFSRLGKSAGFLLFP